MGLDMYLERRELIKSNGGSMYECATNPLIRTVEITSVGYWRKAYELNKFICDITNEEDYDYGLDVYLSNENINKIIIEARARIKEITYEIELLKRKQQDKRIKRKETELNIKRQIQDRERELSGWKSANEIFTKAKADLEKNENVSYYYSRS